MPRIITPEWRAQNQTTRYPFAETATMITRDGLPLIEGVIIDAAIYPVGGGAGMYLTAVDVLNDQLAIYVGSEGKERLCRAVFLPSQVASSTRLDLIDQYNRAAGTFVITKGGLSVFQAWGFGLHEFAPTATPFVASVCVPTPEVGVRGVILPDGQVLTGDFWLVGGDGVVLKAVSGFMGSPDGGPAENVTTIEINIMGDPMFRRRLCAGNESFDQPLPIKAVRFTGPDSEDFTVVPDAYGNIAVTTTGVDAPDTVLRIATIPEGLLFMAVGKRMGT